MLVTRIWKSQPGEYFCLATKDANKKWRDHWFTRSSFSSIDEFLNEHRNKDLYFCPHGFTDKRRLKPYTAMPNLLWSDMDEADPRTIKYKPTVAIESSPGRYVGIWFVDRDPKLASQHEAINRRLSYAIGGDPGGWDFSQVLRVPGTLNFKYSNTPRTRILWSNGPTYKLADLAAKLPHVSTSDDPTDASDAYKRWEKKIPWSVKRELNTKRVPATGKRSEVLFRLCNELFEAGVDRDDALLLLKASVWNKFRGRSTEDKQLMREWNKATNKHYVAHNKVSGESNDSSDDDYQYLSRPLSDLAERDVQWVWYPYLALGKVTILQGDPEAGKSFISQNVTGAIACGEALPAPWKKPPPPVEGRIVYFDMENDPEDTTLKRLRWNGFTGKMLQNIYQETRPFSIDDEEEMAKVYEGLERVKPTLVVVDTLMTYIGKADTNSGAQGQQSFAKFKTLAERFNCAVLVLRHLTKGARDKAMYRGQGNIAFTGLARIELTAGRHPEDEELRVMAVSKTNLTRKPPALCYEVLSAGTEKERDRSAFEWGEFIDLTADQIVMPAEKDKSDEKGAAEEFLRDQLKDGSKNKEKLISLGETKSLSARALQRAARKMGIISKSEGFGKEKSTRWSLPA